MWKILHSRALLLKIFHNRSLEFDDFKYTYLINNFFVKKKMIQNLITKF